MLERLFRHVQGNVVGYVALFIALSGTAWAATALPANSVGTAQLQNGAVTRPKLGSGAVTAGKVAKDSLTGAQINESTLGPVPSAGHATDADQLGGNPASAYQQRVTGTCDSGISSINQNGTSGCTQEGVFAIDRNLASNKEEFIPIPGSNFQLDYQCQLSGTTSVLIDNLSASNGNLNYLYSTGSTVYADGTGLPSGGGHGPGVPSGGRVEGQFIASIPGQQQVTVNLHALDKGSSGCEFTGTAEYASG